MRKIITTTTIFLFLLMVNIQTIKAQENQQARQMIVGKWKFDKSQVLDKSQQNLMDGIIRELNESLSYLEYKADGTWESNVKLSGHNRITSGRWEVSKDGKILISTPPSGNKVMVNIVELSKHKMTTEINGIVNTNVR